MRLVRFLYCLCALLIGGSAHLSAALPAAGNEQHPAVPLSFAQHYVPTGAIVAKTVSDEAPLQLLLSDESEDEDSTEYPDVSSDTPVYPAVQQSHPSFSAALWRPGNRFRHTVQPMSGTATYLLLRVLRI